MYACNITQRDGFRQVNLVMFLSI